MYAQIEPDKKSEIDSLLKSIVRAEKNGGIFYGDSSVIELKKSFEKLFYSYIHKKGQYVLQIPLAKYEENFWNHRLLEQYLDEYCTPEKDIVYGRDFYMAQNILSVLNYYGEDTKMVVWAHNGHIAKKCGWAATPTMGYYLNQVLGDNYYCIGFDFYRGKFQSIDMGPVDIPGPVAFEVPEAPRGNLSWYFAQTGLEKCFIDLTSTEKSEIIDNWINNKEMGMYFMGSGFSNTWLPGSYIMPAKLFESFDGIIFIRETNRAIPKEKIAINNFKF
jgi:erythromycin esterase